MSDMPQTSSDYYFLQYGDIIQKDDEYLSFLNEWTPLTASYAPGATIGKIFDTFSFVPMRRYIGKKHAADLF